MIAGFRYPSKGTITIEGPKVGIETQKIVSFMPDSLVFDERTTIKDAVAFYRNFYPVFDLKQVMDLITEFKMPLEEHIVTLSKGEVGKLQLILTFSRKAKVYILDEPLGGVHLVSRKHGLDLILKFYREDCTILISTHLVEEIESIFDEVIFLKDGNIVLHENVEEIRFHQGKAVHELFREVFEK